MTDLAITLNITEAHGLSMGYRKDTARFSYVSPAKAVSLNLYTEPETEPVCSIEIDDSCKEGDIFSFEIKGKKLSGLLYDYSVCGENICDPFATRVVCSERLDKTLRYYGVIGADNYDWNGDKAPQIAPNDLIIYKLHAKGFTASRFSGVTKKGTFAGLTNKIDYIRELGVNAVEIMPAYEFVNTSPNENYWGYEGGFYYAPKRAYCNNKGADYVNEFKMLVREFHRNGIEVFMEFFFPKEVGAYVISDCLRFWHTHYHIDGAHVICDERVLKTLADDPFLKDIKLLAARWDGDCTKGNLIEYNDGFLDNARHMLKGDENYLRAFMYAMRKNPANAYSVNYVATNNGFTLADVYSYDRKHNEANGENNRDGTDYNISWNCGVEGPTRKKKVLELRMQLMKNALSMVLLSQGIPLIYAGDEFGNSQNGNNNAYCQDNETGWLDWKALKHNGEYFAYVRRLIAFRKEHEALHQAGEVILSDYRYLGIPDVSYHGEKAWYPEMEYYIRYGGIMTCGAYAGDESNVYVAYNMHWESHTIALPSINGRRWTFFCSTDSSNTAVPEGAMEISVPPRSILVLVDEKNS